MSSIKRLAALSVCLVCFASESLAQGGATGAIVGTVQDKSGAVIAGAQVNIVSAGTGQFVRQLTSDSSGLFSATLLQVGAYSVEVSATGFATTKFPDVEVRITETTRMTAVLAVNSVQQQVEVNAEVATVNTVNPTTGESLGYATINNLPLATRNFQQILTLSAGAASDLNNASQLGRGQVFIHVNGGREDNNNYLIDGISAADYAFGELTYTPLPNPDAIQEFKVSTSLYDASQGRNGGGNINATLRSGTGKIHGDVWEYFRNTSLDAHDYFLGKVIIKQNIFGGDLGGPIGPQAKLGYFYVNYQGTRQRSGASPGTYINTSIPVLPTDRTAANLIRTFFPNGLPPGMTSIDPVALALLNEKGSQFGGGGWLFPTVAGTPGFTNGTLNYGPLVLTDPGKFTDDQFTANWDRDFRAGKDHLAERFFWSNSATFQPFGADSYGIQTGGLPGVNNLNFPLNIPLHSRFGSITETHLISNTLVNEFRFGINVISDKLDNKAPITGADIGINLPTANQDPNMYRLQFGTWAFGPYPTQLQYALSDNFVWLDTLSWSHGPHQLRFGGEIDRVTLRRSLPVANNGLVFFAPPVPEFGNDFLSFLGGDPSLANGGGGLGTHDYRVPGYAWFVQDDYRIRKDLTLNLGFRNEFVGAPYDTLCRTGNTNPELANTTGQPFVYPKCANHYRLPGLNGTLNQAGLNNEYATVWEPRIGFAYDVGGHHTTTIRAGYGIYSVREDLGAVDNLGFSPPYFPLLFPGPPGPGGLANLFQPNPAIGFPGVPPMGAPPTQPYVPVPSFFRSFPASCTLGNGAPGLLQQCGASFSGNVPSIFALSVPLHWVAGTTQQWNFSIQRQFGRNWYAEVGYVGTKGSRLRSDYDPNQARLATPQNPVMLPFACSGGLGFCRIVDSTVENASARAPFLGIGPGLYETFAPNSDSHYNALQATLGHRFGQGLYLQSAYTFANSIDDVSNASVAFVARINDQINPRASRGLSDFAKRQRWVTSAVYQFPSLSTSSRLVKGAFGGWQASPVIILQSGSPFTVFDPAGGSAYQLASPSASATFMPGFSCGNALSSGSKSARLANWINRAAYQPDPFARLSTGGLSDATLYGNTSRNCLIGPSQKNVDFSLGKIFKLTEGQNLRFLADFFNILNHPSFANPAAPAVGPTSGSGSAPITSTIGTPRLIQFSVKYSF
ncbi:MAG: carboxypeptidase regulatory-like domain-containing protein [Acidobacteria bacterium]|nr:carboxypeptidase regulatory-like domain-containing protein [Acidobacteriota bacterium]